MPTAGVTHDYTLEDVDGSNKRGFMLRRDRRGRRGFAIRDAETIAPRLLTKGAIEQAEFPPAVELVSFQHNWAGGLGGVRELRSESLLDAHFLADGNKVDSSGDGRLRLAQELRLTSLDLSATAVRPSGFAVVGTELWAFIGRDVYSWDFTNGDWEQGTVPEAAAKVYRNGVEYQGRTFAPAWNVAGHTPARYIYKADADPAWSLIGAGTGTQVNGAKYFAKGRNAANADILWAGHVQRADATVGQHIIVSSTNPTDPASWSGEVEIGGSDAAITNLLIGETGRLLVFKTNGIWTYEADGTVTNLTPSFEYVPHADNFRAAFVWQGRVLAAVAPSGLVELSTQGGSARYQYRDISLRHYLPLQTDYHQPVVAIWGDEEFVYLLVHDADRLRYYLLKGELVEVNGQSDYRWHRLQTITYTTGTDDEEPALFIEGLSGVTDHHRLWIGVYNSGSNVNPYYYPLSDVDLNWGYTNDSDAEAVSVQLDFGLPRVNKRLEGVDLQCLELGAGGRQLSIDYRRDDESAWTTWVTVNESPQVSRDFPAGTTAKILELRIKPSQTSVGATSPVLVSLRVRGQLRPEAVKTLPLTAYLADNQQLYNGARASTSRGDRSQLRTWDSQPAEVILRTPDRGQVRHVIFWPGTYQEEEAAKEPGRRAEYLVSFLLADVRDYQSSAEWDEFVWDQVLWA